LYLAKNQCKAPLFYQLSSGRYATKVAYKFFRVRYNQIVKKLTNVSWLEKCSRSEDKEDAKPQGKTGHERNRTGKAIEKYNNKIG
jgi:hypothetical protein